MSELFHVFLIGLAIVIVIIATSRFKLNPFFVLISVSIALSLFVPGAKGAVEVLREGFGATLGSIGLIIVFGTCLGVLLDKSGATMTMAATMLRITKPSKAARAIALTGTVAGLPIFCDSGFIVLSGLNKSLSGKSGISIERMAGTLAISLFTMHCFVPPHPGITAAAGIVGVDIGRLLLFGLVIAFPGALAGYLWIKFISRKITQREEKNAGSEPEEEIVLPSRVKSFLPVLLPLALISGNSLLHLFELPEESFLSTLLGFLGNPAIALFTGILLAFFVFPRSKVKKIDSFLLEGIERSGPILLITAAGGTFGAVIRNSGMGDVFSELFTNAGLGLLIPYIIAVLMKTAQGSSTVAAITAASIIAPMIGSMGLDYENGRIFVLLALGAGTMAVSHTNDSYFWVVSKFSGLSPRLTMRIFSSATIVVSIFTFIIVLILAGIF